MLFKKYNNYFIAYNNIVISNKNIENEHFFVSVNNKLIVIWLKNYYLQCNKKIIFSDIKSTIDFYLNKHFRIAINFLFNKV